MYYVKKIALSLFYYFRKRIAKNMFERCKKSTKNHVAVLQKNLFYAVSQLGNINQVLGFVV